MLTYLDGFEEQLWEVEDDPQAHARVKQAAAAYKGEWGRLLVGAWQAQQAVKC